jgi:FkbM family methyltransferase
MSLLRRALRRLRGESRMSFALNGLDLKLLPYLDHRRGFFVEAGANDGVSQSNTLYFERYMAWRGLLVEPVLALAERCRANRPACIVENCALVSFSYGAPTISMRYANLMSVVDGAFRSREEADRHVQLGCEIQNVTPYEAEVPAATLSSLLDKHRVSEFDLLSLDVEGYELNALMGLDLDRHAPRFMLIEARFRKEVDDFLASRYTVVGELSHHDVLYEKRR